MSDSEKNPNEPVKSKEIEDIPGKNINNENSELRKFLSKPLPFLRRIKTTPTIIPVYFFFYAFGITFLISFILFEIPIYIEIPFYITELDELVVFSFPVGDLLSVILFGGIFSLSALRSFEYLRESIDPIKKSYGKRLFIVILYVFFMILLIIGEISHMIANQLYKFIHDIEISELIDLNSALGNIKVGLYLWDELIGHILIGFGFYGMLYINTYLDLNTKDYSEKIRKDELFSIIIAALILGVGIALSFIEGQFGLIGLLFAVLLVISILYVMHKNKLNYFKNPFVLCTLILNLVYIITVLIYMPFTGLKPYYPFLFQPSELYSIISSFVRKI